MSTDPKRYTYPDPRTDEKDWPIGMGVDGEPNYLDESAPDEEDAAEDDGDQE